MDPRELIAETLNVWGTQDVETTFERVADDVVYALHFDEDLAPYAGVTYGKEAMKVAFYGMIAEFDYLKYEPVILGADGDVVRVQTQFRYHHRRTAATLEGSMRTIFTVKDGLIVRCEEYLDRGLVESFMRLTRHREAKNDVVAPPAIPSRRASVPAGAHQPPRSATQPTSAEAVSDREACDKP